MEVLLEWPDFQAAATVKRLTFLGGSVWLAVTAPAWGAVDAGWVPTRFGPQRGCGERRALLRGGGGWGFVNYRADYHGGNEPIYGDHFHSRDCVKVRLDVNRGVDDIKDGWPVVGFMKKWLSAATDGGHPQPTRLPQRGLGARCSSDGPAPSVAVR